MILNANELIGKSKDQRNRKRYEEALVSSEAAARLAPDNSDAWWEVALNRLALGHTENAIKALKKTVELCPEADNAWALLGANLSKIEEKKDAKDAFLKALDFNPRNTLALEEISKIYASEDDTDQDEAEASILTCIEELSYLDSDQLNRFGIIHYRGHRYHEAIKYWRQNAFSATHPANLFNLGLAYNRPEISQDADAVDMWRMVLRRFPNYEPPKKSLTTLLPRMLALNAAARRQGPTLLPRDHWYEYYLNPFELLNLPENLETDELEPKTLQKLKKALLQEIDLEEGAISWVPGVTVDKSRAIQICDELNDENKRYYHRLVFTNRPLLAFLSKGSHEHFLVDENNSPLDTLEAIEDDGDFFEWLGDRFAPQFDRVLCKAIDSQNLVVLECLLDGRRWVPPTHADRCFENARRAVDRLIEPLRNANRMAENKKPTIERLETLLNHGAMVSILNLLPSYFEDFQNQVVHEIRGIALSCFNAHDDIDLSRQVIEFAKRFHFRSAHANHQIDEDISQIENLIKQERQHEVKLVSGSVKWEIAKEGIRMGDQFIPAADVTRVRWGIMLTGERSQPTYDFLLSIGADDDRRISYTWKTSKDIETQEKFFSNMVNATFSYIFPSFMKRVEERLASGSHLTIGPCKVTRSGLEFEVKGWIFAASHTVPWERVRLSVNNGDLTVKDAKSPDKAVSFSLRDTDNAAVIQLLANQKR